jgi:hypothetical protein
LNNSFKSLTLTGLVAKLSDVFFPNESAAERFFGFFTAGVHRRYCYDQQGFVFNDEKQRLGEAA